MAARTASTHRLLTATGQPTAAAGSPAVAAAMSAAPFADSTPPSAGSVDELREQLCPPALLHAGIARGCHQVPAHISCIQPTGLPGTSRSMQRFLGGVRRLCFAAWPALLGLARS